MTRKQDGSLHGPPTANSPTVPPDNELIDFLCTEEEVCALLSSINPSKSNGPDSITPRMLLSTAEVIAPAVTKLFNLSLTQGKLPTEWKAARVVSIPKFSQTSNPSNYRSVSLLSVLSKLHSETPS